MAQRDWEKWPTGWARNDILEKGIMEGGSLCEPLPIFKSSSVAEVAYLMSHFRWVKGSSREEVAHVIDHFSMGSWENLRKVAYVLSHFFFMAQRNWEKWPIGWARNDVLEKGIMENGSLCEPLPIIKSSFGAEVAYLMSHFKWVKELSWEEVAHVIDHFSIGSSENLSKVAYVLSHFFSMAQRNWEKWPTGWARNHILQKEIMESGSLCEPLHMPKSSSDVEVAYLMSHFRWVKGSSSEEVAHVIDHFSMESS